MRKTTNDLANEEADDAIDTSRAALRDEKKRTEMKKKSIKVGTLEEKDSVDRILDEELGHDM